MSYIDRDAIPYLAANDGTVYVAMKQYIDKVPDADVVSKAEYDRLKFEFDVLDHECDRMERAEDEKNQIIEQQRKRLNEYKRQIIELQEKLEQTETKIAKKIFAEINKTKKELNWEYPSTAQCQLIAEDRIKKKYKVED